MPEGLSLDVLGPLRATFGTREIALGGPKQRCVLAVLTLEVGRVVSTERLIAEVWGVEPPTKATGTLQVYVSNLRRALNPGGGVSPLVGRPPGYVLELPPASVDKVRFGMFAAAGRQAEAAGRPREAADALRAGLELWRGDALSDLPENLEATRAAMDGERLSVSLELIKLRIGLGEHMHVLAELETLAQSHPLDEQVCHAMMLALYRSGRQVDALSAYRRMQVRLDEDLGLEPSVELRVLQTAVLAQDKSLLQDVGRTRAADLTIKKAAPLGALAWLVFPDARRIPLGEGRIVIGRGDDCDVTLADPLVSRRHAIVRGTSTGYDVADEGTTNGTAVNGMALQARVTHPLADGDEIELGALKLRFTTGGEGSGP